MSNLFATMIVPDAYVEDARRIASGLSPSGGTGMFTTGLSASGEAPATHWISSGHIGVEFWEVMQSPATLKAACDATEVPATLAECTNLVELSDISQDEAFVVMEETGLMLVQEEAPSE